MSGWLNGDINPQETMVADALLVIQLYDPATPPEIIPMEQLAPLQNGVPTAIIVSVCRNNSINLILVLDLFNISSFTFHSI